MQKGSAGHCCACSPFQCHLFHPCHPCHLLHACSTTVHPCEQWQAAVLGGALSLGVSLVVGPLYMVVSCPSPFLPWLLSCSCDACCHQMQDLHHCCGVLSAHAGSSLAANTHNPPCKQWLTGLGVGAGSSVVVVGGWGRGWAVPCCCGTLVHGFIRGGCLSNVIVGHGVCSFRGHRCSTFIT